MTKFFYVKCINKQSDENLMLLKKEENNKNKSNKLLIKNCNFNDSNLNVYDDHSIFICKFCDQHCHGKTLYLKHVNSSHATKEEKLMSNPLIIITKN